MYFDEKEREVYEAERKFRMDRKEEIATAEDKGRVEGIQEGEKKKSIEIAKNLLKNGVSMDIIEQSTGLSTKEINKLKN